MSLIAGFLLTRDPVEWHLQYWLNIEVVGLLRGEDMILMAVRVQNEIRKIENAQTRDAVDRAWDNFRRNNRQNYRMEWLRKSLASSDAQPYLRDIDRMLVNKEQKMRDHIRQLDSDLLNWHRTVQAEMASKVAYIGQLQLSLAAENLADQERDQRLQAELTQVRDFFSLANDVHDQEGENSSATEVEVPGTGNQPLHLVNEIREEDEETPAATEVEAAGAEVEPLQGVNDAADQEEETPAATEVETAGAETQPLDGVNDVRDQQGEPPAATEVETARADNHALHEVNEVRDQEEKIPAAPEMGAAGAETRPLQGGSEASDKGEETPAAPEMGAAGAETQPLHGVNEVRNQQHETPAAPEVGAAGARPQLLDAAHYAEERASEEDEWRQLQQEINDYDPYGEEE